MNKLLTSARTTEVNDISDRLLVLYKEEMALAEDIFLKPLFGEMQTMSNRTTEAIKATPHSGVTGRIRYGLKTILKSETTRVFRTKPMAGD